MINLDLAKPGDMLLGKQIKGVDDRWCRPRFTMVRIIDKVKGEVEVQNKNKESQIMLARDLFTYESTLRYMDNQIARSRQEARDARKLVVEIATSVAETSPEVAAKLADYLASLTSARTEIKTVKVSVPETD